MSSAAAPKKIDKKQVAAFALYDFANSAYPAVITVSVFSVYYARAIVGNDDGLGDLWWGRVVSASMVFVALSSPVLGAIADNAGVRKRLLAFYTYLCVICVALFTTLEPGMVMYGFALAVLANIGFEGGLVFYNAYLPDIAPPEKQGSVSGLGFGIGYLGSVAGLLIALPLVGRELFDLTWLSVAVFFAAFSLPAFLGLPADQPGRMPIGKAAAEGFTGFGSLVKDVWELKDMRRFLLAYFIYTDGVMTTIYFSGIYASGTLDFTQTELIMMFLLVQVSALIGALLLARPTDTLGPKRVVTYSLVFWTAIVLGAYFVETKTMFFAIAGLAGTGLGVVQAASRALMSRLIPDGKEAEMFGFYAFCGKSSSVLGPLIFGYVSYALGGNQRIALLSVGAFFLIGLILMRRVTDQPAVAQT